MNVDIGQGASALTSLRNEWAALCARMSDVSVFSLPDWHIAWSQSMGAGREVRVLTARDDGGVLIGVLPFSKFRGGARAGFARVLEFSGGTQADVHELIAKREDSLDVLEAFRGPARDLLREADVARLTGVPEDSPLAAWDLLCGHGVRRTTQPLPYVAIGNSLAAMERKWHKSHRTDLRRQTRRLEEQGVLTLHVLDEPAEAKAMLRPFLDTHAANWAHQDLAVRAANTALEEFFARLIDQAGEEPLVHFSVLEIDGVPCSFHLGFLHRGHFYWYKPAYVRAYANYSPGKVHVARLLALGAQEGWRVFDLLSGDEPYKRAWADQEWRTVSVRYRKRNARAMANTALTALAGRVSAAWRTGRRFRHGDS